MGEMSSGRHSNNNGQDIAEDSLLDIRKHKYWITDAWVQNELAMVGQQLG